MRKNNLNVFHTSISCYFVFVICILLSSCSINNNERQTFSGSTMGTRYHITVFSALSSIQTKLLHDNIKMQLNELTQQMSSYQDDSQLMQFNARTSTDPFEIKQDFYQVLSVAKHIYQDSAGSFDISVSPLIDLWGFSKQPIAKEIPTAQAINAAKIHIGLDKLHLHKQPCANKTCYFVQKSDPLLSVNVSAIAKGYAVDVIAEYLAAQGIDRYLVEIGGEAYAAGTKPKQGLWRLGLETPDAEPGKIQTALLLQDKGVATSGDYRNYYVRNGKRYSHTLDPRTGRPVEHTLASVTVISDSTMEADAWATTLNVLGPEKGFEFALQRAIASYFIVRDDTGFVIRYTPLFEKYLEK